MEVIRGVYANIQTATIVNSFCPGISPYGKRIGTLAMVPAHGYTGYCACKWVHTSYGACTWIHWPLCLHMGTLATVVCLHVEGIC